MKEFTYATKILNQRVGIISIFEDGKERRYAMESDKVSIKYLEEEALRMIEKFKVGA